MPELSRPTIKDRIEKHRVSPTYLWNILFEDISKEWISFKPTLGLKVYPCYSCRHMFSSLTSLQDHVNRRIILLKYQCTRCSTQKLTFYNRCSFLLHARTHFDLDRGHIDLSHIEIFPLPVYLAGFLPHESVAPLFDDVDEPVTNGDYVNAQFYSPDAHQKGSTQIQLAPSDLLFERNDTALGLKQTSRTLPKCEFVTLEEQRNAGKRSFLVDSGTEANAEIKNEPSDYANQVTLPIISKVESLQDNLPRCLDCNTVQYGSVAEHYQGHDKPTDSLICSSCKFVASTECSLKAHERIHSASPPHVCPDCGTDFPSFDLLNGHMSEVCFHLSKSVRYRCPGKRCGKLFATPTTFAAHFRMHFNVSYTCCLCKTVYCKTEDAAVHATSHQELCKFRREYECTVCADSGALSEPAYEAHLEHHATDTERCMYAYMCKHCRSYFRSTATYAVHASKCVDRAKSAALQAKTAAKYATAECDTCHDKIVHPPEKTAARPSGKRYFCILCSQQIRYQEKLSHMRACRYARPTVVVERVSSEDAGGDGASPGRRSRRDDGARKRRRRHQAAGGRRKAVEPDLTAEQPVRFEGVYECKACGFASADRGAFHAHVKTHRDISTAYQCMECGECFVVKPSLYKHLTHFHKVCDYAAYLRENDCYDVEAVQELQESMRLVPGESREPVAENQCRVCRVQFDDAAALNIHFRIHGMAFLMRNAK